MDSRAAFIGIVEIKNMIDFLILTLIAVLMIISPGPDFAVTVKNSLTYGRSFGVYAAFGIAFANLCHIAINLLGLGVIITKSMIIFMGIKILGAIYLIYLGGRGIWKKPLSVITEHKRPIKTAQEIHRGFYSGLLTSILNPKVFLFYLSFFSLILSPATAGWIKVFYGVWMSSLAALWFTLVAIFFTSPFVSRKISYFKQGLERFTGGVLILLGLKLLGSEFSRS